MYKYILQSVEGIQWFGIVSFFIFFGTFCLALFHTWRGQKAMLDKCARLPLED
jgi:hypothetical protein